MKSKERPPRKLFFSRKGRLSADMTFLEEPDWYQDAKDREVLRGKVLDNETGEKMLLEQYPPDAYDLSQSLVQGLGSAVTGKRAVVRATVGSRKLSDGKTVEYIETFTTTPAEAQRSP